MFASIKAVEMFVTSYVSQLVRKDLRVTNQIAECSMRMTENPIIYIRVLDVVR